MAKQVITREAGAVLNKKNRSALQLAFQTITGVLEDAGVIGKKDGGEDDEEEVESEDTTKQKKKPEAKSQADKPRSKNADAKEARSNSAIIHSLIEAGGFSYGDLAALLQNALNDTRPESRDGEYIAPYRIVDIFDDYFVYCIGWSGSECYRVDYTVSEDGTVSLAPPIYVNRKVTYISPAVSDLTASEAGEFVISEEYTRLAEAAVAADGTTLIKLIAPGMGSTGLYTPDVLTRDGAAAFPKNTKMFWDHDTLAEESARPEGTLTRLAAVTLEDARYIPDHRSGAGLYARAQVFESYRDDLNEIADYIGTSIRADGQYKIGDYNGARVPIITTIKPSNGVNNRVDFVTAPGAGGRVLSLFESARQRQPQTITQGDQTMDEATIKKLVQDGIAAGIREAITPLQTEVARLREAGALREARAFADTTLAGPKYSTLPATTRDRIAGTVSLNPPLTESGAIDAAKLVEAIETAAKTEATYLSTATGRSFAIGLGESRAAGDDGGTGDGDGDDNAEMTEMFTRWGLPETAAKVATTGRVIR